MNPNCMRIGAIEMTDQEARDIIEDYCDCSCPECIREYVPNGLIPLDTLQNIYDSDKYYTYGFQWVHG